MRQLPHAPIRLGYPFTFQDAEISIIETAQIRRSGDNIAKAIHLWVKQSVPTVIGIPVDATDYLPCLYRRRPTATFDNPVAQIAHH